MDLFEIKRRHGCSCLEWSNKITNFSWMTSEKPCIVFPNNTTSTLIYYIMTSLKTVCSRIHMCVHKHIKILILHCSLHLEDIECTSMDQYYKISAYSTGDGDLCS